MAMRGGIVAREELRRVRMIAAIVLVGIGWSGLVLIAISLLSTSPPQAGFDLALVLEAGRRVAEGRSPYDPALLAGSVPPSSVDLFFAYPPLVAQGAALAAGVPVVVLLFVLWIVAVGGLGWAVHRLAVASRAGDPALAVVLVLGILPFVAPFSVALLFGNLDVLFPTVFALLLWWVMAPSRTAALLAGFGVALAVMTKLGPAIVLVWLAVRATRERDWRRAGHPATVLVVSLATIAFGLMTSSLVWGSAPWQDYLAVSRLVSGAELVELRNIGPAAQVALFLGVGERAARVFHLAVLGLAVVGTAAAARKIANSEMSLLVAVLASLVTLPITWFHYPASLLPFAITRLMAVGVGGPGAWWWAPAGLVVASLAVAWPPLLWLAVGLVVVGHVLPVGSTVTSNAR